MIDSLTRRLPADPLLVVGLFLLSTLTLVFSMIVASRLAGGIDFGSAPRVAARAGGLVLAVTLINLVDCGIFLAGPVWYFGLMGLFHLDFRETRILTQVNWGMNLVWKLLLLTWKL